MIDQTGSQKADAKPGDPENPAAGIVKAAFDTIRQQNGVQQIHFGLQVENPNIFQLFISELGPTFERKESGG